MTRSVKYPLAVLLLTLLFVFRIGELSAANLLVGAAISSFLVTVFAETVFRQTGEPPPLHTRVLGALPFAFAATRHVLEGTARVIRIVLSPDPDVRRIVVDVPFGDRNPLGVHVTGLALTLSPGSYLLDVDWEERTMFFHVVGVDDPDRTREDFQAFYRDYQSRVFP